eukprot:863751-Prorocentrum_minimum.AAC.2
MTWGKGAAPPKYGARAAPGRGRSRRIRSTSPPCRSPSRGPRRRAASPLCRGVGLGGCGP